MNKKVLFILHTPQPIHGAAIVGQTIMESKTINESFECRYINLGTSRSIDEIGKNPVKKAGRYLALLWKVLVELIRFRPQLCYITLTAKGAGFYKDALVVFLVKLFGVKRVYHFHNKGVSTRQHKRFDNAMNRCVFRRAHVILLSKYLYPDIQKYVSEERVHFCLNGIPDQSNSFQKINSISNQIVEILFLSNLIESKGVFSLLDACKMLHKKGIQFKCTLAGGDGDLTMQDVTKRIEELQLNEFVSCVGKKFGEEKIQLLKTADIFIHPSYDDCVPLVIIEAMQHGLPVISTFEGGIPDLIEDGVNGFLVPQKDAAALAEKMEILIKDSEKRQQMGAAGRKKYEEQFTLDVFENRMKNILETILSTNK